MSTIDYKEKYKQALEVAQRFYNNSAAITKKGLKDIFPELAESEDERIREELIEFCNNFKETGTWKSIKSIDAWIAWLENIQYAIEHAKREGFQLGYRAGIEKQGEQIPANSAKTCKVEQKPIKEHNVCDFCDEKHGCVSPCPTKLIEEEKPAIEQKFKVGDWVFIEEIKGYKQGAFQIKSIDEFGYNFDEYHIIPLKYEELLSKWTIQDAKKGDVLSDEDDRPFIFKGFLDSRNPQFPVAYCGIDDGDSFFACRYNDWWTNKNCFPTTKEQRYLLFQKMHEAGYEWDAEQKQLKKIEQKQVDKVDQHSLPVSDNSSLPTFDESVYHPCKEEVYEQKPAAWSEENDQLILSDIIYYCKEARSLQTKRATFAPDVCIDWLKSLKDKVQPQPKQEWSEEDESRMDNLCHFLEEYGNQYYGHLTLQGTISWLKSLKPQPRQEWGEEDELTRKALINLVEMYYDGCIDKSEKNRLLDWLKSIRLQLQWKPSREQMYNLSEAAHYNCAFFDMEILKGLYDDLKQLKDV